MNMHVISPVAAGVDIERTVDSLGVLKAQIAALEDAAKPLVAALKALGPGAYAGTLYDATVSEYTQERLDMAAVRKKLSRQFIAANTIESAVVRCDVKARVARRVERREAA